MSKKLSATNPYLRDPVTHKEGLWVSAKTSSAVEGIRQPFSKDAPPMVSRFSATGRIGAKSVKPHRGK